MFEERQDYAAAIEGYLKSTKQVYPQGMSKNKEFFIAGYKEGYKGFKERMERLRESDGYLLGAIVDAVSDSRGRLEKLVKMEHGSHGEAKEMGLAVGSFLAAIIRGGPYVSFRASRGIFQDQRVRVDVAYVYEYTKYISASLTTLGFYKGLIVSRIQRLIRQIEKTSPDNATFLQNISDELLRE